ncbi:lysophospholipid acyltransferase family protein [Haematobacter massiliensis]|uniref:lysophospholipid acyltransferase family protein n=1 Tax=Haematobacter massiliensis TaxID=195105 RepID=UPI001F61C64E|nr:lysophospholipid acyltransferase family protein [Haematobacter massiliensis]
MSRTWQPEEPPPALNRPDMRGWIRVICRAVPMVAITFPALLFILMVRFVERPLARGGRPVTARIKQFICRIDLALLGISFSRRGQPMTSAGILVANHSSWLDILVLGASAPVTFVSKDDVAGWPGIGLLARGTGTMFITRDPKLAVQQRDELAHRLAEGELMLFFPEGTSSDGRRILPFKPALFESLFLPGLREKLQVQPVSVRYHAPEGEDPRFHAWFGNMDFGPHALNVLAAPRGGAVEVILHPPVRVRDFDGRKSIAAWSETAVRDGSRQRA